MIEMHVPQEDLHLEKMAHVLRDKTAIPLHHLDNFGYPIFVIETGS